MNQCLVSIITPSYNCSKYIAETIESIIAQTYTNWELLITDDCSTDNSRDIIQEYCAKDSRIKLYCLSENSGAGAARNNSINEANGRYIAFCDSDDRWYQNKLEKQVAFMQHMNCGLSYTSYMTSNEAGELEGIVLCRKQETFATNKRDDKIGCLTAMYDTAIVGKVYMPLIRKRQDWGLMLNVLRKCNIAYGIKEPLAIYRLRENSISSNKLSLIKYNIGLYREVLGWTKVRATLFFFVVFLPSYFAKKILIKLYNN